MQFVKIKAKSERVTVTVMWLGFAGSLSCICAGFITFGILIRYSCATWETHSLAMAASCRGVLFSCLLSLEHNAGSLLNSFWPVFLLT